MNHRYLSFLLALFLAMPVVASAQEGESEPEGDVAAAPEGDAAAETTDEDAAEAAEPEEEAAPEPQPEPEVSAVESEMGDPSASGSSAADDVADAEDEAARAAGPAADAAEGGEGGEGGEAPAGGRAGLRWDLETGRWVEDSEPLPWRNSLLIWNNSVSLDTFLPGARRSYNPTYIQTFSLRPRWYLSGSVSLRLRQDLNWELTHDDINNNSATFNDTQVQLIDTNWFSPGGVAIGGGLTAFIPVSISSRNCGLITGLQGSVSGTKVIPGILEGVTLQAFGALTGNFHYRDVCQNEGGDPYPEPVIMGNDFGDYGNTGGVSNSYLAGQVGLFAAIQVSPAINFGVTWLNQWSLGRNFADATAVCESCPGGTVTVPDMSDSHTRVFTFFSLSATWLTNEWLNMSLSYGSFNFSLDGSGNVYNPFYNPQSQFTLQAVVFLDRAYQGVESMLSADDVESEEAATARNEDDEDSNGEQVATLSNRRAAQ